MSPSMPDLWPPERACRRVSYLFVGLRRVFAAKHSSLFFWFPQENFCYFFNTRAEEEARPRLPLPSSSAVGAGESVFPRCRMLLIRQARQKRNAGDPLLRPILTSLLETAGEQHMHIVIHYRIIKGREDVPMS
ncbi:unnamed protein product [Pleuronectes platessa]|uniref:Uncharacterized protein n=1 Tax=Pleuronectes platessa TaxID=8262 RepID=A0A9N7V2G5_PLEPL|nr:unnamed protein product [Pleuronectes platessa]